MIEEKDAELIASKLKDQQDQDKKKKKKIEGDRMIYFAAGLAYAGVIAALIFVISGDFDDTVTKKYENIIDAQNEIIQIKSMACAELMSYTPTKTKFEVLTLEILQRCV